MPLGEGRGGGGGVGEVVSRIWTRQVCAAG